jgi:hypothetical protein
MINCLKAAGEPVGARCTKIRKLHPDTVDDRGLRQVFPTLHFRYQPRSSATAGNGTKLPKSCLAKNVCFGG